MSVGFFLGNAKLEYQGEGWWQIMAPLCYQYGKELLIVPEGFVCDLDSVPRLPMAYSLCKGRSVRPPILHDYLYREGRDRKEADWIFLDAMESVGVPCLVRWAMWGAVRMAGWSCYRPMPGILDPR